VTKEPNREHSARQFLENSHPFSFPARYCTIMPPEPTEARTVVYRGLPGDGLDDFIRQFSENAAAQDPFGNLAHCNRLKD